jgi:hypothetical protein
MPVRTATVRSTAPRLIRAAMLLALTAALAGCVSNGNSGPSNAFAQVGGGGGPATIAFESIDGPPPPVFDRMVNLLDSESKLRNVAVVSRQAPAAYRVRGYLAAHIRGGRTTIAWVWDVYDRDQQRALRLSGEEAAGKAGRDAWAQADDLVLRRIAQAGLTGLSNALNGAAPDQAPGAPARSGPAIAAADDTAPAAPTLSFASAGFSTR